MDLDYYFENLILFGICSEETLSTVTAINGYNEESLNDILYVRTGYRSWDQYLEVLDLDIVERS